MQDDLPDDLPRGLPQLIEPGTDSAMRNGTSEKRSSVSKQIISAIVMRPARQLSPGEPRPHITDIAVAAGEPGNSRLVDFAESASKTDQKSDGEGERGTERRCQNEFDRELRQRRADRMR